MRSTRVMAAAAFAVAAACQVIGGIDDRDVYRDSAAAGLGGAAGSDAGLGGTAGATGGAAGATGGTAGATGGTAGATGGTAGATGGTAGATGGSAGAAGAGGVAGGGGSAGSAGSGGSAGSAGGGGSAGSGGTGGATSCVKSLVSGALHTCAIRSDDATLCWGRNDTGQALGAPGADATLPSVLSTLPKAASVGTFNHDTCVVPISGVPQCWGLSSDGQLGEVKFVVTPPKSMTQLGSNVSRIAGGYAFGCAVIAGGVQCWGNNAFGQMGQGNTGGPNCGGNCTFAPQSVPGLSSVTAIATGWDHACAIQGGGLSCWGSNAFGQVGTGSTAAAVATPYAVFAAGSGIVGVAAGQAHTCALKSDGSVWCWGKNTEGQVGTGVVSAPVTSPTAVVGVGNGGLAVAAGAAHSCVIRSGGALWCWGANGSGQLGRGVQTTAEATAAPATALSTGVSDVAAGETHTCVRLSDASARCFGGAQYGQMGNGSVSGAQLVPVTPAIACP